MDQRADVSRRSGDCISIFNPACTYLPTDFIPAWIGISSLLSSRILTHSIAPHRYLKVIDKFFNNYISCFMTGGNVKFLLLHQPTTAASAALSSSSSSTATSTRGSTSVAANPTSPQTEEAVKSFFLEVYENYIKAIMSPFYRANMEIRSPVFRSRVAAAGRKYL